MSYIWNICFYVRMAIVFKVDMLIVLDHENVERSRFISYFFQSVRENLMNKKISVHKLTSVRVSYGLD